MARRPLDKGLDVLLKKRDERAAIPLDEVSEVLLDNIEPNPHQPRQFFDTSSIDSLAASIKQRGVVQPVVVRTKADGKFELVAGERRWRAARKAKLKKIPVVVRNVSDEDAMILALVENLQREDLSAFEEATALKQLSEAHGMTHGEIASAVGKSRTAVTNLLRLLNLHTLVLKMLQQRELEEGHARALLALETSKQLRTAKEIASKRLTVRQSENLVKRLKHQLNEKEVEDRDPDVERLENELADRLGAAVAIRPVGQKGKGMMSIRYASLDQLDGIIAKLMRD